MLSDHLGPYPQGPQTSYHLSHLKMKREREERSRINVEFLLLFSFACSYAIFRNSDIDKTGTQVQQNTQSKWLLYDFRLVKDVYEFCFFCLLWAEFT